MPGQLLDDVIGKNASRRDLSDIVTIVDAKDTPFVSMVPKGQQSEDNMLMEWPADKEEEPTENAVVDNADVTEYDDALGSYAVLQGRLQWARRAAQVSKLAQVGQNMAGIKDKMAKQIAKKIIQLKRDMEIRLCGDGDSQAGTATVPYKTRGVGHWIRATAQTDLPVDASYLTPSASIETTASASLTEAKIQAVLESQYKQTGKIKTYSTLCGTTFKGLFKNFTQTQFGSANVASAIRTYNQDLASKKIVATVDVYQGDFGTMELIPSLWLAYLDSNGATQATVSGVRAYNLDMDMWQLVHKQKPQIGPELDFGGGKRRWVDTIYGLKCFNPLAEGKFAGTT